MNMRSNVLLNNLIKRLVKEKVFYLIPQVENDMWNFVTGFFCVKLNRKIFFLNSTF